MIIEPYNSAARSEIHSALRKYGSDAAHRETEIDDDGYFAIYESSKLPPIMRMQHQEDPEVTAHVMLEHKDFVPPGILLRSFTAQQYAEVASGTVEPIEAEYPKEIFDNYLQTNAFFNTYKAAIVEIPDIAKNRESFIDALAGEIFADMAFHILSQRVFPDRILLNIERSEDFFARMQTGRVEEVKYPFGHKGLRRFHEDGNVRRISSPDGFLIRRGASGSPKISAFVEYTTQKESYNFCRKTFGFHRRFHEQREDHPQLFDDGAEYIFVVPKFENPDELPSIASDPDVEIVEVGFSHWALSRFIDDVYYHYTPRVYRSEGVDKDGSPLIFADSDLTLAQRWESVRWQNGNSHSTDAQEAVIIAS
ncbi:MAG: hypothetical protein HY428_00005 [Candidatus Levybacteria bacterium]|nr:hypothetical protein [Candidatus Levybacteria bacterium]